MVAFRILPSSTFAAAARPKDMRQLGQRKNASTGITCNRLLPKATQQRDVVFADGLVVAPGTEFAFLAMFIEDEGRLGFVFTDLPDGFEQAPRSFQPHREFDPNAFAIVAAVHHAKTGDYPLHIP